MIIHAMGRLRAHRLRPNASCALISISTPGKPYPAPMPSDGWLGLLALEFDDVSNEVPVIAPEPNDWLVTSFVRFDQASAEHVVKRAVEWRNGGCADLVIHCDAGLARSVAIAQALASAGLGTLRLWECEKPLQANPLVFRHMSRALTQSSNNL